MHQTIDKNKFGCYNTGEYANLFIQKCVVGSLNAAGGTKAEAVEESPATPAKPRSGRKTGSGRGHKKGPPEGEPKVNTLREVIFMEKNENVEMDQYHVLFSIGPKPDALYCQKKKQEFIHRMQNFRKKMDKSNEELPFLCR